MHDRIYDVFIDLSKAGLDQAAFDEHIDRLRDAGLGGVAGQVTLVPPSDFAPTLISPGLKIKVAPCQPSAAGLAFAVARAAASHRHLVVLVGAIAPSNEALSLLIEAFDRDPLFGTTQPRFAESGTDRIWPLPSGVNQELANWQIGRSVLSYLPFGVITPELLAACLVLRWNVLAVEDTVDQGYASNEGALLQMLWQARRLGLRNLVVNRAVVASSLTYPALYPVPPRADLDRLHATYPEKASVDREFTGLTQRRLEPLLTAAHPGVGDRPSVLLDCRGMSPRHNGTARATLGLLDGFAVVGNTQRIDILASPKTAAFHRLSQRYPGFRLVHCPTGAYAAAFLTNQPWSLATVAELHRHALVVAFNMLDTIMWDTLYMAPDGLESVWRFIARHADGLLYISSFTQERFNNRFPVRPDVQESVAHLSFMEEEQTDPSARATPVSDHILLVGNDHDHKDVSRTLQLLVDGFPFDRIVVVGSEKAPTPNVVAIPSGNIEQRDLHGLIASAKVIVFPSYYEGFGLPVVEGLAYGRPVLVRSSPLWAEIAAWSRLPGSLIEFDDAASLIEGVGRVIAGMPCQALPSGVKLAEGAAAAGWRECAQKVIGLLDTCIEGADGKRWLEREDALRLTGH